MIYPKYQGSESGFYAGLNVEPISSNEIYVGDSDVNGYGVHPVYIGILNVKGGQPVQVLFPGGYNVTVGSRTNQLIKIDNGVSLQVTNLNDSACKIFIYDENSVEAARGVFTGVPNALTTSDNDLLIHFTDGLFNDGNSSPVIVEVNADTSFVSTGGKFSGGCLRVTAAPSNAGGARCDLTTAFDLSKDFTIDYWYKRDKTTDVLFQFRGCVSAYDGAGTEHDLISFQILAGDLVALGFGVVVANATVAAVYTHIAVCRRGNRSYAFVNGVKIIDSAVAQPDFVSGIININCGGVFSVIPAANGDYSEFRMRRGAIWTQNFAPPQAPYV